MTLDEIIILAAQFEKIAMDPDQKPLTVQESMEIVRKQTEVKNVCLSLKKLCDIIEAKYKTVGKSKGFLGLFDPNFNGTMGALRKAHKELENAAKGLDKVK